ncbi:hypothetical protein MMC07_001667 [Pseudocyphellaria aurata]|nr:hypothetical protein [Pseudocyphellaria aurata]
MTEGSRVIRFQRRYYSFYNRWDSYPQGLGTEIVNGIPVDPRAYQRWLAEQRKVAREWHDIVERYLCRPRADYEGNVGEDEDGVKTVDIQDSKHGQKSDRVQESKHRRKSDHVQESKHGRESVDIQKAKLRRVSETRKLMAKKYLTWNIADDMVPEVRQWAVSTEFIPEFMPICNDGWKEWVYTIDLDREVFTVNNLAHFHLNRIPRPGWKDALAFSPSRELIFLSSCVPEEAIADLVVEVSPATAKMHELYESLNISVVKAKGLNSFPSAQRHGPLLRAQIFDGLQYDYDEILSATLLNWRPDEFHFREIAYAFLCLASASSKLSFVRQDYVLQEKDMCFARFENEFKKEFEKEFENEDEESAKPEFLAHLAIGGHLEGYPSGSSPESGMYWFDGALVCLAGQIDKREAMIAAIARLVEYCRVERPNQCVDSIVMSIEHIVLARIYPDGRMEVTKPLPLFYVPVHKSRKACECYDDLEELQSPGPHPAGNIRNIKHHEHPKNPDNTDKINDPDHAEILDTPETTFMSLTYFLGVSSRQKLPASDGNLPTELYEAILLHVEDLQTYHACMQVSRTFRDLCQRNIMIEDGITLQATDTSETHGLSDSFPTLRMRDLPRGRTQDVTWPSQKSDHLDSPNSRRWNIVIGSERNRRSLLTSVIFGLDPVVVPYRRRTEVDPSHS